jgi:hypothetical protein
VRPTAGPGAARGAGTETSNAARLPARRLTRVLCQPAFVTQGMALVLVGGVGWAAVTVDPARATGLDGALRTIAGASAGPWVLTAIAAGTGGYSVYRFTRARDPVR